MFHLMFCFPRFQYSLPYVDAGAAVSAVLDVVTYTTIR